MQEYNIAFLGHIKELRYRLLYCFISFILAFLVSYTYSLEFFYFLAKPLINLNLESFEYSLIYTDITEAFFTYLNLSLYVSFGVSSFLFIHHIILFLISGLYITEAYFFRKIKNYIFIACFISLTITYYFVIPFVWYFFISNETSTTISAMNIHFEGKLNEYVFILLRVFFSILCIFLIPIFLFVLVKLKLISLTNLVNQRKFAFILIFVLGALLSPPDVISQVLLAIPLCLSYECIIFIIIFNNTYYIDSL